MANYDLPRQDSLSLWFYFCFVFDHIWLHYANINVTHLIFIFNFYLFIFPIRISILEGSIWFFCVHSYLVLATVNEVSRLFCNEVDHTQHIVTGLCIDFFILFYFLHSSMFWDIWKVNMFSFPLWWPYPNVIKIHYFFFLLFDYKYFGCK